jgi:hypothetical protein
MAWKFDQVSITTVRVHTRDGEAAARQYAEGLLSIAIRADTLNTDLETSASVPGGVLYEPTCMSPRGSAYLVEAEDADGNEVETESSWEGFHEPLDGSHRKALSEELNNAAEALSGNSNDAEHNALYGMAETIAALLGVDFGALLKAQAEDEEG